MFDQFGCMYLEDPKPYNFTVTLSTRRMYLDTDLRPLALIRIEWKYAVGHGSFNCNPHSIFPRYDMELNMKMAEKATIGTKS